LDLEEDQGQHNKSS